MSLHDDHKNISVKRHLSFHWSVVSVDYYSCLEQLSTSGRSTERKLKFLQLAKE